MEGLLHLLTVDIVSLKSLFSHYIHKRVMKVLYTTVGTIGSKLTLIHYLVF